MKKERDLLPDIVRGFAIIMVVLGHCIQEGNGAEFSNNMLYFDDKLYQFIYSFHMPLFALIAGFYAYPSIAKQVATKDRWLLLGRRVACYGIPICVWTLMEYIRECILNTYYGFISYTPISFISGYFSKLIVNHWFLWSMIICFVIVWVMHYCLKDNWIIYLVGFLALFFIPDGMNMHAYKYLMPFYIVAFYVNQNKDRVFSSFSKLISNNRLLLLSSFILFLILFLLYKRDAFIYVSGYRITKNIWWKMILIDIYRMVIGFVGSIFWISFFKELIIIFKNYKFPVLSAFGKNSLGVYLVSGYTTILLMRKYTDPLAYSIPRVLLETVLIAIVSLIISILISKIPVIKKIVGK